MAHEDCALGSSSPWQLKQAGQDSESALREWRHQKEELTQALDRLGDLALAGGDPVEARTIHEAAERLLAGRLTLAVLGEFKRGKSTLINSLLRAEVMPVGVIPMTSVPLSVRYGKRPRVLVDLGGTSHLEVTLKELPAYATEVGNPGNRKGVAGVQVEHPAHLLESGVILIDTPGIGSSHAHNTAAAYAILREADAAVFLLSVDSPASQAELDFLAEVRSHVSHLTFALNKVDLLSESELRQSVAFVRSVLAQAVGDQDPPLFPISARLRDQGFSDLERALDRFLVEDRGRFLLQRAHSVAERSLVQQRRGLAVQEAAMNLSAAELERRVAVLAERLSEVARQTVEAEEVLAADMRRLLSTTVDPLIGRFRSEGEELIRAEVSQQVAKGRAKLRERLGEVLAAVIRSELSRWIERLEEDLGAGLAEVAQRHEARVNALAGKVVRVASEVFEVDLDELSLPTDLEPSSRRLLLIEQPELALERISTALQGMAPGRVGVVWAQKHALRRGLELVDRHCGRVHHDVVERLAAREREWRHEMAQALEGAERTVRQAVTFAEDLRAEGDTASARVRQELATREHALSLVADALRRAEAPGPAPGTRALPNTDWPVA